MESHCHGLVKSLSTFSSYVIQRQLSCHCCQILKQTPANGFSLLQTTLKSGQLFVNVPASPIRSLTRRMKSRKTRLLRPVHMFVLFVSVRARLHHHADGTHADLCHRPRRRAGRALSAAVSLWFVSAPLTKRGAFCSIVIAQWLRQ